MGVSPARAGPALRLLGTRVMHNLPFHLREPARHHIDVRRPIIFSSSSTFILVFLKHINKRIHQSVGPFPVPLDELRWDSSCFNWW